MFTATAHLLDMKKPSALDSSKWLLCSPMRPSRKLGSSLQSAFQRPRAEREEDEKSEQDAAFYDLLEGGYLRESIRYECLTPRAAPASFGEYRLERIGKEKFKMYAEEKGADGEPELRFLLSAKRDKDVFYISPYNVDEDVEQQHIPIVGDRKCAVLKKVASIRGEYYKLYLSAETAGCEPCQINRSCYQDSNQSDPSGAQQLLAEIFHSVQRLKQAEISMREVRARIFPEDPNDPTIVNLVTRFPKWQEETNCLTQKFIRQRVRASSAKNIILTNGDTDEAVFQFGKQSSKKYAIDHATPLLPLHAFGIALSMCNWLGGE